MTAPVRPRGGGGGGGTANAAGRFVCVWGGGGWKTANAAGRCVCGEGGGWVGKLLTPGFT